MSFLYPNTITIQREIQNPVAGVAGYGGLQPANITTIGSGLAASVQLQKTIGKNPVELPGDSIRMGNWLVYVRTTIQIYDRDIIVSNNGQRFIVNAAYQSPLQWELYCEILEA